jgi:hypothetical protein
MLKILIAAAAVAALASTAGAQTATPSPPSAGGNPVRPAPRGPAAGQTGGQPPVGTPTPLDQQQEHESQKAANSVCKGC